MQDNNIREKCRELATRLYELDGEVYESVGSSLGPVSYTHLARKTGRSQIKYGGCRRTLNE